MDTFLGVVIGAWLGWLCAYWWFKAKEEDNE